MGEESKIDSGRFAVFEAVRKGTEGAPTEPQKYRVEVSRERPIRVLSGIRSAIEGLADGN